jgi:hypothetical protein
MWVSLRDRTGLSKSNQTGPAGLKRESTACRYRFHHWIVSFQQVFITHPF